MGVTRRGLLLLAAAIVGTCASAQSLKDLRAGFEDPPNAARPRVWWHWMNGNITQEGADFDLAWMKRVGVGGIDIISGSLPEPSVVKSPVLFMDDQWKDIFRREVASARAYGMEVSIDGAPGWSETGGPWVTSEHAMKKYVWSETQVIGGKPYRGILPKPPSVTGPFQNIPAHWDGFHPIELTHDVYADSAVVAFPTPRAELERSFPGVYSSSATDLNLAGLDDGSLKAPLVLPVVTGGGGTWIQTDFGRDVSISTFTLGLGAPANVTLMVSEDGHSFHQAFRVPPDPNEHPAPEQTYSFAAIHARFFRIVFTVPTKAPLLPGLPKIMLRFFRPQKQFSVWRVSFPGAMRVNRFEEKAGFAPTINFPSTQSPECGQASIVSKTSVIDLTENLRPNGTLDWTPPPGHWTILRIGYSLTGQTNGPAEAKSTGLEVDKLDASLVRQYMEQYLKMYSSATGGKLGNAGVQYLLTDSWEAGVQNWTATMLAQFKLRRGYDATPYLPVLAGWVVGSPDVSDRFLWDFRRTLEEMLADNHYGTIAQVLHEHHIGYYTEAESDTNRAIGDGMAIKARADIPTGEFWYRPFAAGPGQPTLKADLEESASVAHVYGKPFAASESLTVAAGDDPWAFSPAMLKPVADEIFAHGINRILYHESHLQPLVDAKPGLTLSIFGQYFNRNNTYAEQVKPWIDYLTRSSYLLQQGRFVADVAYFYGQEQNLTEMFTGRFNTDVPEGYHYDYIGPEALLTLISVRNGKFVTQSGMQYRVLYVPSSVDRLTLSAMYKLRDLVAAGGTLVAKKPVGSLGLPNDDVQVEAIADKMWGADTSNRQGHSFGKGRVYGTSDLGKVLASERIQPDVEFTDSQKDSNVMTLHRQTESGDIYFITNQLDRPEQLNMTFRVTGEAPELWRAEDGRQEPVSYTTVSGGIHTFLHLNPYEAVFVVFRKSSMPSRSLPVPHERVLASISAPWTVSFQAGRGAPATAIFKQLTPWNESLDPGIKYFSGQATYTRDFEMPFVSFQRDHRIVLDLGEVHELAQVSVNGKEQGIVWHAPYRLDITDALKPGTNQLSIAVTNLWPNRLIGDKQPGSRHYAWAPQSMYSAGSKLMRSGLIGPITILDMVPQQRHWNGH
ncbi:MAG: glycosyl hydrolase [Acidobacteriaceae bacterium]